MSQGKEDIKKDNPPSLQHLFLLIKNPGLSIRAFASKMGVTTRHASRVLKELERNGLLIKDRTGKEVTLRPNDESPVVRSISMLAGTGAMESNPDFLQNLDLLRLIGILSLGQRNIRTLCREMGCSRASIYRLLKKVDCLGPGLLVSGGRRVRTYSLGSNGPLYGPLAGLARSLFPDQGVPSGPVLELSYLSSMDIRALLHLASHEGASDKFVAPRELTQNGMAEALWTSQPAISRTIAELRKDDLVEQTKHRVANRRRKETTYRLTQKGLEKAQEVRDALMETMVHIVDQDGVEREIPFKDIGSLMNVKVGPVEPLNYLYGEDSLIVNRFQQMLESKRESHFISGLNTYPLLRYFFGRHEEIETFRNWLGSHSNLLLVLGLAGIGKTAFLSRMLNDVRRELSVFYFSLNEWSTPRGILMNLAYSLQEGGGSTLAGSLERKGSLSSTEISILLERELEGRKALIVIDDVQKADGRTQEMIGSFLGVHTGFTLKVVLSGRELPRSWDPPPSVRIEMNGLDRAAGCSLLEAKGNPCTDIDEMISLTKGNPLALELLSDLDIHGYKDLEAILDREVLPNLSSREHDILGFLSVLRYPFSPDVLHFLAIEGQEQTLDAPRSLTPGEKKRYRDRMDELASRSFLTNSGENYRLHDLFRDLFMRKMGNEETDRWHALAARYYRSMMNDPARIETIHHLISKGASPEALELLKRWGTSLIKRGHSEDLRPLLERLDRSSLPKTELLHYHYFLAEVLFMLGEWDGAYTNYEASIKECREEGREGLSVRSRLRLAKLQMMRGATQEAVKEYSDVIGIASAKGQFIHESYGIRQLGSIHYMRGETEKATEYHRMAMALAKSTKSKECLANAYFLGSFLSQLKGDFSGSEMEMRACLGIYEELGDTEQILKVLNNLGWLFTNQGKDDEAMVFLDRQIGTARSVGDLLNIGFALQNSADILMRKGQLEEAERRLKTAYRHFVALDEKRMTHTTELTFGELYKKRGEAEKARSFFETAWSGFKQSGIVNQLPALLFEYGDMEERLGNVEKGASLLKEGLEIARSMNDQKWIERIGKRV